MSTKEETIIQKKPEKKTVKNGKRKFKPKPKQRKGALRQARVPYVLHTPAAPTADNTYTMSVITNMDTGAFKTMLFGLASYVLQLGLGTPSARSSDIGFQTIWSGLDFMLSGMWREVRSGEVVLASRPRIIHDMISALANKVVSVRGGKFSYSWAEGGDLLPIATTAYGPVTYFTVIPAGDAPMYNSTNLANFTGSGTLEDYNKLVKYLSAKKNPALALVESSVKSPLVNDVCTRARVYAYCGLRPTDSSGWALSVENEVPLLRPSLSKFVSYGANAEDRRIPTQLSVESGDPCTLIGINILGLAGNLRTSYLNRCAPRFIPLDFEAIYDTLCLWMVKLKNAALTGSSNDSSIATASLPFSQQDFRIALMQSLKGLFETSWVTQFVGPLQYNQDGNAFIPSTCSGNNFGNPEFARKFIIPELISENLNALKARAVSVPRKDGAGGHSAIYIPILGRWYLDTPTEYKYGNGEFGGNLFTPLPQDSINVLDGSMGGKPVDCNNSYYKSVIANWNSHVEALKLYSTSVGPMVRDRGPVGLPLILSTCYERVTPSQDLSYPTKYCKIIADKNIVNLTPVKSIDAKTKHITYVPAATTPQLDLQCTYTMLPQTDAELMTLFDTLILPSIRFNEGPQGDVLNSQMWSVHTRFLNSIPNGSQGDIDTQTKYERWDNLANMCITGFGRDTTDFYARIMSVLADEGKASGLLSILSGLVGAIVPPLAPIAAVVAGLDN